MKLIYGIRVETESLNTVAMPKHCGCWRLIEIRTQMQEAELRQEHVCKNENGNDTSNGEDA